MIKIENLPNLITLARLLSVPIIVVFILSHDLLPAFILFALAGASDALDGFVARIFKARTTFGAYLDPLADKALPIGVYVSLGKIGLIDLWVVILVVFRDVVIVGGILLLFLFESSISMRPLVISKINTVLQLSFALFILAEGDHLLDLPNMTLYFSYLVVAITITSGISYIRLGLNHFNTTENEPL